jgi:predicted ATPase
MARGLDKSASLRAQEIFAEWFERTGDHRLAAARAGVSERTGRRWRLRYAAPSNAADPEEAPKTNLRSAATRFVGRAAALSALRKLFSEGARLCTVTGPGGIGKTRLASQYADLYAYDYAQRGGGGVWFCDLTNARTASDVIGVVGQVLGVVAAPPRATDAAAQLGAAIGARGRLLLVLDNFEQVAAEAPATLERWIELAPRAHFLVTSREQLRVPGEVLFQVDSLTLPEEEARGVEEIAASEAVQLFVDRARMVRPSFELGPHDAPAVAAIVRQLDGIPLAIELAAARAQVLSPAQLKERLRSRFEVLVGGPRGAAARQLSMRAAIDWSWDLLSDLERAALAQCAAFHGGFSLEAAERVLSLDVPGGTAHAVLDVVDALRQRSLVRVEEGPDGVRFGLYESIHAYAAERLRARPDAEATYARHAAYYLEAAEGWAAGMDRHGRVDLRRRLVAEVDNLRAVLEGATARGHATDALRAALCLVPILSARGPMGVDLAVLDEALGVPGARDVDRVLLARAMLARGDVERVQGSLPEARGDVAEAQRLASEASDAPVEGRALAAMGRIDHAAGNLDEALAAYTRALEVARASNDRDLEGRALGNMALIHRLRRSEEALDVAQQALDIHRKVGNRRLEGDMLGILGTLHQGAGRTETARECYERALELLHHVGDRGLLASVLGNLGTLLQELGDLPQAAATEERALAIFRDLGVKRLEGCAMANVASIRTEAGDLEEARRLYDVAVEMLHAAGDAVHEGIFLAQKGGVESALGRIEDAKASFAASDALLAGWTNDPLYESASLQRGHLDIALARLADGANDPTVARAHRARVWERIASAEQGGRAYRSDDVRIALRLLKRALEEDAAAQGPRSSPRSAPSLTLYVTEDGRAFRAPGGKKVDLERRRAVRLILQRLAQHRVHAPGESLPLDTLLGAGWPGERVLPQAGASRVYVALGTLRRLGLRGLLVSRDGGYLLDPKVPIALVNELR